RVEFHRAFVLFRRLGIPALTGQEVAQEIRRSGGGLWRRDGKAELALGRLEVSASEGDLAETTMRLGLGGIEPKGGFEVPGCLLRAGRRGEGVAQIDTVDGHPRLEAHGLLEVRDRLLHVTTFKLERAEVAPGTGTGRPELRG